LQQTQRFMQERELWFPCGAHRMRYLHLRAVNPRPLPAVVFVHGLMGYSFSWRHNLEYFAQHREVYAVDLLGIGHSDRPEAGAVDFGFEATASRLLNFMRSLGHARIDLVATSHGGAVAMLAASLDRAAPQPLVHRMALVAPAHPFMNSAELRLAFFSTDFGGMLLRNLASHSAALRSHAMGGMYSDESRISPETRAGYAVNLEDVRSYDYALAVVGSWQKDMQKLEAALPSIASIPVLLLWGADDHAVPASSGLRLQQCFRDAEYVVFPGVGHLPYEEAPAEFNRRLLRFLDR
jgi:pimeloyl-ACP methyl ester carboxylesterase